VLTQYWIQMILIFVVIIFFVIEFASFIRSYSRISFAVQRNIADEASRVKWTMMLFTFSCIVMATRMITIIVKDINNEQNLTFVTLVALPVEQLLPLSYVILLTHYRVYSHADKLVQEYTEQGK
jgi:hypothetical protein